MVNKRTTLRVQALLLMEARKALSLKLNSEVYSAITPITDAIKIHLGGSGMLSHYRGNSWGVTWFSGDCGDNFVMIDAKDLALSPQEFIQKIFPCE